MKVSKTLVSLLSLVSVPAFAAAPTSATDLVASISTADLQSAGLAVTGLLITVGVVLWGARLVMAKFRPHI